jgi:hypothetical protein
MRRFALSVLSAPLLLASPAQGQGPVKSRQAPLPPTGGIVGSIAVPAFRGPSSGPAVGHMTLRLYRMIDLGSERPLPPRLVPVGNPWPVRVRVGGAVRFRFTNVPVGVPLALVATYSGPHPLGKSARVDRVGWSNPFVVEIGQSVTRDLRVTYVPWPPYVPPLRPGSK